MEGKETILNTTPNLYFEDHSELRKQDLDVIEVTDLGVNWEYNGDKLTIISAFIKVERKDYPICYGEDLEYINGDSQIIDLVNDDDWKLETSQFLEVCEELFMYEDKATLDEIEVNFKTKTVKLL